MKGRDTEEDSWQNKKQRRSNCQWLLCNRLPTNPTIGLRCTIVQNKLVTISCYSSGIVGRGPLVFLSDVSSAIAANIFRGDV